MDKVTIDMLIELINKIQITVAKLTDSLLVGENSSFIAVIDLNI